MNRDGSAIGASQPARPEPAAAPDGARIGRVLRRYERTQTLTGLITAAVLALATAAEAGQLGRWAAVPAGLSAVVAATVHLRARWWARAVRVRVHDPGAASAIYRARVTARPCPWHPVLAGQRYLDILSAAPGRHLLVRIPLIAGQDPPPGWQQEDPVTVIGVPRPGRVTAAAAAGTVLLPAGRARWPLASRTPVTISALRIP